jgi:NADH dehydrogenase FAD-containing subunit
MLIRCNSLQVGERLRSRMLAALESVDRDASPIGKGALNFFAVGAGPTGVETAGLSGTRLREVCGEHNKNLDLTKAPVFLSPHGR